MTIPRAILREFPDLNAEQREAIDTTEGPLLVIAGPGSGKTLVLVIRALNVLMKELARPNEILLCTFTEKAAFELRDRLSSAAKKVGYTGDLSELLVGTIHGICNDFLLRYRHRTNLGNNYEVLDDLTQLLFLFDHFDEIIGPEDDNGHYLTRWTTRWTAIQGARNYFNKITEEMVDPLALVDWIDPFTPAIGQAYRAYRAKLLETNHIDFAHQQSLFYDLLDDETVGPQILSRVRYVMVDEYQDTNYVQEQLLLRLAGRDGNICVVGDEDQALYRFRGGTVRNILEFPGHFKKCGTQVLSKNYRSHKDIIYAYDDYMSAWDWSNPDDGPSFRYPKTVEPDPEASFVEYPAVFSVWGQNERDEARRFADMVAFMKEQGVIEDESQVALLLHSVRSEHSGPYLDALAERGIPAFCPRARAYFDNDEVRLMVGCFAILLGYHGAGRGTLRGRALQGLADYTDLCITELGRRCANPHPLAKYLQDSVAQIAALSGNQTLDQRLADYFYRFLAHEPFASLVANENRARNLATFSQLLNVFQNYYHYTVITARNREPLRFHFFNSFLRLLHDGGINEYEDPDQPFPKGYVQVMTIHQSKGLEFPVVVVGSLAKQLSSPKDIDRTLGLFYARPPFELEDRITGFDRMRLHYVAFSRAEKVLVLTSSEHPKDYFDPIWQGLPQWPYVQKDLLKSLSFKLRERMAVKKMFSFTSDLKVYETCPRQYQFFRHYEFMPARSAEFFFGALVHQTIEDIHRRLLDGSRDHLVGDRIRELFDFNYRHLVNRGIRPVGERQREEAFTQVMNYVGQNRDEMERVIETEVDVSVEKDNYILTGKIDLLMGGDGKLELLDFKAQPRPVADEARLDGYRKQLCIYAHILEQRYGKTPDRLLLYWTGEPKKRDALMVFPYQPKTVKQAGLRFDRVVEHILAGDFLVRQAPEIKVCEECDLRSYCTADGTVRAGGKR